MRCIEKIVKVVSAEYLDEESKFSPINWSYLIIGGPQEEIPVLTGRKIIVDTYGG